MPVYILVLLMTVLMALDKLHIYLKVFSTFLSKLVNSNMVKANLQLESFEIQTKWKVVYMSFI